MTSQVMLALSDQFRLFKAHRLQFIQSKTVGWRLGRITGTRSFERNAGAGHSVDSSSGSEQTAFVGHSIVRAPDSRP